MATLFFVRHGQAGPIDGDYDQLSPLGAEQLGLLGRYWAEQGLPISRAWCGPLTRQRLSCERFTEGLGAPVPVAVVEGLREYDALTLVRVALSRLVGLDPEITRLVAAIKGAPADEIGARRERLFQTLSRRWVRGAISVPEVTPFAEFREGVARAIDDLIAELPGGETALVFTSGGVVAAALGYALGLGDERTLELSWIVRNSALTEFHVEGGALSLVSFNVLPHLAERRALRSAI